MSEILDPIHHGGPYCPACKSPLFKSESGAVVKCSVCGRLVRYMELEDRLQKLEGVYEVLRQALRPEFVLLPVTTLNDMGAKLRHGDARRPGWPERLRRMLGKGWGQLTSPKD